MKVTETYIDFGGTVYTFDQIDKLPHTKENALVIYLGMTCRSWTFARMTETEKEDCVNSFLWADRQGCIFGTFRQRWMIMQGIYTAFLSALGYDRSPVDWRENGVDVPRVIVEVDGGNVTNIYSDKPISVDVMDFDNLNAGDEYAEEVYQEFHATKGLTRVY